MKTFSTEYSYQSNNSSITESHTYQYDEQNMLYGFGVSIDNYDSSAFEARAALFTTVRSVMKSADYQALTSSLFNNTFAEWGVPRSPLTFAIRKYLVAQNDTQRAHAKKIITIILGVAASNVNILNYKDGESLTAFDYADKYEMCDIASDIIKVFNDAHNHKYVDFFLGTINGSRHKAMARILCTDYTNANAVITGDVIKQLRSKGCIYERFIFNLCCIESDAARSILQNKFFTYKDKNGNSSSGEWTFGESININKIIDGKTILFQAIETGSAKTVKLLLDSFSEGILQNVNGVSPIDHALNFGRRDIAELIFAKDSTLRAAYQDCNAYTNRGNQQQPRFRF